jgi:hypothetical protein
MSGRSSPLRIALATLGLVFAFAAPAGAQLLGRYAGFEYDTVFRIGAHTVPGWVTFARDTLKLDFTYHYQPTWDNTGVSVLASRLLAPANLLERLDTSLYLQTGTPDSLALRTIFIPDVLKVMVGYLDVTDNFAFHNPELQVLTFDSTFGTLTPYPVANDATMLRTLSLPATTAGPLVKQPRFVSTGGFRRSDSTRYCKSSAYPFFNIGKGDSTLGRDSSYMVRFGFHFHASEFENQDTDLLIAKVIVWRRLTTEACRCAIYEPDTMSITKGQYDAANSLNYPLQEFRDVGFWLDVRDSAGLGWFNTYDTTYYRSRLGAWMGERDTAPASIARCQAYLDSLKAIPGRIDGGTTLKANAVEGSDIYYDFHTTGRAKITLLRGRVATHEHEALVNHRFDSLIANEVRALFIDSNTAIIRKRLWRIGAYDEPSTTTFDALTYLTDTLRALVARYSPDSGKPWLYQNPTLNYDGFRRLQFDLDSTLPKRVHMMTRQQLAVIQAPVPVYYVRPDKMIRTGLDSTAWKAYYPPDSLGFVAFNGPNGYSRYTDSIQSSLGRFRDYPDIQVHKALVPTLARMVSVSRFEHAGVIHDSVPVYNVVTSYGAPGFDAVNGFTGGWLLGIRPKTPEEMAVQAFLSFNGAQGFEFDELSWDGRNLGIADRIHGTRLVKWTGPCTTWPRRDLASWDSCDCGEWDTLPSNHPKDTVAGGAPDPKWRLPQMWLGLRSRFLAAKRIVEEIRRIAPVYQRLYYKQEQMSVHDMRQSFSEIPMVERLQMQRAETQRLDSLLPDTTSTGIDAREETYAELSHFYPGPRDSVGMAKFSRYIAITNRRTHPVDTAYYGTFTQQLALDQHLGDSARTRGLGYIDMRRPLLVLKNSTPVMADSFLVEKVGHEDSLFWRVGAGDSIALDWLEPGWGGLYRITPVTTRISLAGTAFNNAVHSENPSTDLVPRDRIVVYERDSIVYLRTVDTTGTWRGELRVSDLLDAADTAGIPYWQRRASCIHPAIATVRDGTTALIVWERIDRGSTTVTVEGLMLHTLPSAASTSIGSSIRMRIAPARPMLAESTAHAPSVVGLNGGYAVAYPSRDSGVSVSIIRSRTSGSSLATTDSLSTHHIKWDAPVPPALNDSTYFPTLAFAGRYAPMDATGWAQTMPGTESPISGFDAMVVHLAYQQGKLSRSGNSQIMYNMVGARFRPTQAPILWVSPTEHVSAKIPDCGFRHPSIAADSARVGIAFQGTYQERIVLRFRDTSATTTRQQWTAPIYSFGSSWSHRFDWPSLTQFPAVDSIYLEDQEDSWYGPDGALVWSRPDVPSDTTSQTYMYRYGWSAPERLHDGIFPTMTLAAKRKTDYLAASSILMHGDSTTRANGPRPFNTSGVYYPAMLDNNPTSPSPYFLTNASLHRTMTATGSITRFADPVPCPRVGSLDFGIIVRGPIVRMPPTPPDTPSVAPSFFGSTPLLTPSITNAEDISSVTRTGIFKRSPVPVSIDRVIMRASGMLAWLDEVSYDTSTGEPNDVLVVTELVRDADSVVLWRDDTVSVRAMSTDTLKETVEVPSHLADTGTVMYIRLRAIPSDSLEYEASAGFIWDFDAPASWLLPRRNRLHEQGRRPLPGRPGTIELSVAPNPTGSVALLTIATEQPGVFDVALFDAMGRRLRELPSVIASRSGEYKAPLDLADVAAGIYLVRVDDGVRARSVTVTVAR